MRVSQEQSTGFNIILAATGALAVVAVVIKQVYEGGTLPVGTVVGLQEAVDDTQDTTTGEPSSMLDLQYAENAVYKTIILE